MQTELTPNEIEELILRLESKMITTLEHLFEAAKIDYKNLHEILGLSPKALTRLKKNPKDKGTLDLLKHLSEMTGIRASVIVNTLGFGKGTITLDEMENIVFEETILKEKRA